MTAPIAILGDIPLATNTYPAGLNSQQSASYAEHARVGQKPRLQWTGDNLDELRMEVNLHAMLCQPEAELAKLTNALHKHEAMKLVWANGYVQGQFVILNIDRGVTQTARDGTVLIASLFIVLREYTEDGKSTEEPAAQAPVAVVSSDSAGRERVPTGTVTQAPAPRAADASPVRAGKGVTG